MESWGLVLSGGAANGIANAGVVQILQEQNIAPNYIAGSSMGAIIAALYATGHPSSVFDDFAKQLHISNVARITSMPFKKGLHSGLLQHQLKTFLQPLLGNATISDCNIPFICVAGKVIKPIRWLEIFKHDFATKLEQHIEKHVFGPNVKLLDAITASSSIPVLFHPTTIDNDEYIDLVHYGAIPAMTLQEMHNPATIIATDTNPTYPKISKILPQGWRNFLDAGYQSLEVSKSHCDLIISPEAPYTLYRFDKAKAFIKAGRYATYEQLTTLKELIAKT